MNTSKPGTPCAQQGAVALATSLVMLFSTALVVMYASKQGVIEQWVSGNESRYNYALAQAEAGLEQLIARYRIDSTAAAEPTDCDINIPPTGSFCAMRTQQVVNGKTFQAFVASGTSDDDTAITTVTKYLGFVPLIGGNATPAAAIVVSGTMGSGGNFNVVVNPNGGGTGVPISIWSSAAASLGSSSATCHPEYMSGNACPNGGSGAANLLSEQTSIGADIVDNAPTVTAGGTFPDDVFEYLFGVPVADYEKTRANAKEILTAAECNTLDTDSRGLYWIEGGGTCDLNDVGQADNPATPEFDPNAVVLVLDETETRINANNEIYGYVFTLDHPGDAGGQDITLNGGAKIFGSFLSNYDMGSHLNGTMGIIWADYGALFNTPSSSDYGALAAIPGGWRDF